MNRGFLKATVMNRNLTQLHDCEYVYRYNVSNVNSKNIISVSAVLLPNNIAFTKKCTVEMVDFISNHYSRTCATVLRIGRLEGLWKVDILIIRKSMNISSREVHYLVKQPFRSIHRKSCSEKMQQNLLIFSCKFAAYFQNTFSYEHHWRTASVII